MGNSVLLDSLEVKQNIENEKTKLPVHFIVIEGYQNKKIRIPCSNEKIAKHLLTSYSNIFQNKS